jgi:hypothetical protein
MFDTPELLDNFVAQNGHACQADQCAFGAKWKKRTTFLTAGIDVVDLKRISALCDTSTYCMYNGQRHFYLNGNAPGGKLWTVIAKPYPTMLAFNIAWLLRDTERHRNINIRIRG